MERNHSALIMAHMDIFLIYLIKALFLNAHREDTLTKRGSKAYNYKLNKTSDFLGFPS